jgi:hypothetical protein
VSRRIARRMGSEAELLLIDSSDCAGLPWLINLQDPTSLCRKWLVSAIAGHWSIFRIFLPVLLLESIEGLKAIPVTHRLHIASFARETSRRFSDIRGRIAVRNQTLHTQDYALRNPSNETIREIFDSFLELVEPMRIELTTFA